MKSFLLLVLAFFGAAAALDLDNDPVDGHKKLHEEMKSIFNKLSGTAFPKELQHQLNRTQRVLVLRIHPFLNSVGMKVKNQAAYHSLLHHLLYAQSRNFVNTSKALDNMAETSVMKLHKAQMLNTAITMRKLQHNLAIFFNQLHNYISRRAQLVLRKHGVQLGIPHVHFLIHISARAIFQGKNVHQVISEQLRVIVDKKMSVAQRHRLEKAAVELASNIQDQVRTHLKYLMQRFLAKKIKIAETHPIFIHTALHHFKPLLHHCPKGLQHLLGKRYQHYKDIAKKAFGPGANHHFITRLHGYAGPITVEHMNRVAVVLKRHHQEPRHSVIGYLGAYHLRPNDEVTQPWYKCFTKRIWNLMRYAWLVLSILLGGILLGTAIMVILSKKRRKKMTIKKVEAKDQTSSKLPYISLVEEKVPIEA